MDLSDEKFEEFLRGFGPRMPRALPAVVPLDFRRILAVAALAFVAALSWLGFGHLDQRPAGRPGPFPSFSSVSLTRIAIEDRQEFDSRMSRLAPLTLPNCEAGKGSLFPLAKD